MRSRARRTSDVGLRDYGHDDQIGLEETPDAYVAALVEVFREVWRVLRDTGSLWIVIGDAFNNRTKVRESSHQPALNDYTDDNWSERAARGGVRMSMTDGDLKEKDLIGLPWMLAFALRSDGWYLRQEVIWSKTSCMPESVRDRCTRSHETVFMLSKRPTYFYDADAVREPHAPGTAPRPTGERSQGWALAHLGQPQRDSNGGVGAHANGRNKRSVWTLGPEPFTESHFATYPTKLVEPMILAGCPEKACADCGAPYERIVEGGESTWEERKAAGATWGNVENPQANGGTQRVVHGEGVSRDLTPSPGRTVGFAPSCDCTPCRCATDGRGTPVGFGHESSTNSVPPVRRDVHSDAESEDEVLLQEVLESAHGSEQGDDAGLDDEREGLRVRAGAGTPDGGSRGVCPSASPCDGRPSGKDARSKRGRASQERDQVRQPDRESRTAVEVEPRPTPEGATQADHVSALWEEDRRSSQCAACGGALAVPGRVLDPFAGAGTTSLVATRLKRSSIGIELNESYAQMARDRIKTDIRLGHRSPKRARPLSPDQASLLDVLGVDDAGQIPGQLGIDDVLESA